VREVFAVVCWGLYWPLQYLACLAAVGRRKLRFTWTAHMLVFDQPPILKTRRTLVPLRAIFEALGAHVDWDGETRT
jgi:hypothetical protein